QLPVHSYEAAFLRLYRQPRVEKNFESIRDLRLYAEIHLDKEQLDERIRQGVLVIVDLAVHRLADHLRVVVDHGDQDIRSANPNPNVAIPKAKVDDLEQAMSDEVVVQGLPCWRLEVLRYRAALLDKGNGLFPPLLVLRRRFKDAE